MCVALNTLSEHSNICNSTSQQVEEFHVRCIAHVTNLVVNDCLTYIHKQVDQFRKLLIAVERSVEKRDFYKQAQKQLGLTASLSGLDIVIRWSSTFRMEKAANKARPIIIQKQRKSVTSTHL